MPVQWMFHSIQRQLDPHGAHQCLGAGGAFTSGRRLRVDDGGMNLQIDRQGAIREKKKWLKNGGFCWNWFYIFFRKKFAAYPNLGTCVLNISPSFWDLAILFIAKKSWVPWGIFDGDGNPLALMSISTIGMEKKEHRMGCSFCDLPPNVIFLCFPWVKKVPVDCWCGVRGAWDKTHGPRMKGNFTWKQNLTNSKPTTNSNDSPGESLYGTPQKMEV